MPRFTRDLTKNKMKRLGGYGCVHMGNGLVKFKRQKPRKITMCICPKPYMYANANNHDSKLAGT